MGGMDNFIIAVDKSLRVMAGIASSNRPNPSAGMEEVVLADTERSHSAALMRVNHVGEVCAQALYESQGRFSANESMKEHFRQAGREEEDHLAWTAQRLKELGSHPSLLNPLWYAGAYAIGAAAARMGDARSLGFVVETERQVEAHLTSHLQTLPVQDEKSKAIVMKMRSDEAEHGAAAHALGASELPLPIRRIMQVAAKIMTTTAYYL